MANDTETVRGVLPLVKVRNVVQPNTGYIKMQDICHVYTNDRYSNKCLIKRSDERALRGHV